MRISGGLYHSVMTLGVRKASETYLVRVGLYRQREGPSKPEITKLETPALVNEQILRLHVTVHDPLGVALGHALDHLVRERLDRLLRERVFEAVHVLLQVLVQEVEDQPQAALGVDEVFQRADVGVVQLLEEGDLPDGGRGDALVFVVQADLLEGYLLLGQLVDGFVDDAVGALTDLLYSLVSVGVVLRESVHCYLLRFLLRIRKCLTDKKTADL
jgi:hypothetical protein